MLKFLQIAVPILAVADFLIRWIRGWLDWFSITLFVGLSLFCIGSFIDDRIGEWLAAAAGIIFVGRCAAAYYLIARRSKKADS
jgi:hypothetical protein